MAQPEEARKPLPQQEDLRLVPNLADPDPAIAPQFGPAPTSPELGHDSHPEPTIAQPTIAGSLVWRWQDSALERSPVASPKQPRRSPPPPSARWPKVGVAIVSLAAVVGLASAGTALWLPLELGWSQGELGVGPGSLAMGAQGPGLTRPATVLIVGVGTARAVPAGAPEAFGGPLEGVALLRVDPEESTLSVLVIPPETQVQLPGIGMALLSQVYQKGGVGQLAQSLRVNFPGVGIDRSLRVHGAGLRSLVEGLGGVEVFVPLAIPLLPVVGVRAPVPPVQGSLPVGWQSLDGWAAVQFMGSPAADGVSGRWRRQQLFWRALGDRLANPGVRSRLGELLAGWQREVQTDLSAAELAAIADLGAQLAQQAAPHGADDRLRLTILPGWRDRPDGPWQMDLKARDRLLTDWFVSREQRSVISNELAAERFALVNTRLAVQAAGADPATVATAVARLRAAGFTQVRTLDPWPDPLEQTLVVAQTGDHAISGLVRRRLGQGEIVLAAIGDFDSDVTIRLGRDWPPGQAGAPPPQSTPRSTP